MTTAIVQQKLLDQPRSLLCACANGVAGVLVFALLPILVGSSIDTLAISEIQAGGIVSYYYGVYALTSLLSMFWIRRFNWRKASLTAAVLMLIGLLLPIVQLNYDWLIIGMALTGAGAAIAFPLSLTMVADMTNKDRAYGIKLAPEQLIPAALLIFLSSQWVDHLGLRELLIAFTLAPIGLLIINQWMPSGGLNHNDTEKSTETELESETRKTKHISVITGVIALIALSLFFLGFSGLWAFCERIAVDSQLDAQLTGQLLALGLITSGVGPIIGAIIANRFGSYLPLIAGTAISCLSLLLLLGNVTSRDFALVMLILPCAYYFSLCYFFSIIADADANGKISGLMAFALAVGAALGSASFGYLRSVTSMENSLSVIAFSMVLGTVMVLLVKRKIQA